MRSGASSWLEAHALHGEEIRTTRMRINYCSSAAGFFVVWKDLFFIPSSCAESTLLSRSGIFRRTDGKTAGDAFSHFSSVKRLI